MHKYRLKDLLYKKPLTRNLIFFIIIIVVISIMFFTFFKQYSKTTSDYYLSELQIYTDILEENVQGIYEDNKGKILEITKYYSENLDKIKGIKNNIENLEDFEE